MSLNSASARSAARPVFNGDPSSSISSSVIVPPGCSTVYLSGQAAWIPGQTPPAGLDTEAQTGRTIEAIQGELAKLGLTLADVVMMRTYLVADPKTGKMDFAGYSRAYRRYFLDGSPRGRPARSTVEVARLALDDMLVEIEVIAAMRCGEE